jgi:hypothetical protein
MDRLKASLRTTGLLFASIVVAVSLTPLAHAIAPGRVFYEMILTAPGTRSQGWHGVLYARDGNPIDVAPGQTVTTPLGEFVNVACIHLWDACGLIRTDMAEWMKSHQANIIMDSKPWLYRMYVSAEGSKSEVWTSRLTHDGAEIFPDMTPMDTPMGPFRTGGPMAFGWAQAGWFPASWHEPTPPPLPSH